MTALQTPKTIAELARVVARCGKRALFVSNGDSANVPNGKILIDISGVPQIHDIEAGKDKVTIGTGINLGRLAREADGENGLLRQAASLIANPLVRNRVILLQALDPESPYFDVATPLVLLESKIRLQSPTGKRSVTIQDYMENVTKGLKKGEIPTQIEFLRSPRELRVGFFRVARIGGKGSVSAAVRMKIVRNVCKDPEIVVSGLSLIPLRTQSAEKEINGQTASEGSIKRASSLAATEILDLAEAPDPYERTVIEIAVSRALRLIMEGSIPA